MTEAYTEFENVMKWYGTQEKKISNLPFNFDLIMDLNDKSTATDFKAKIDKWITSVPAFAQPNWVLGNHDRTRVASRYPGRADSMNILLLTLPGIAVTYNVRLLELQKGFELNY